MRFLPLILILLFTQGCSNKNITPDYALTPESSHGVLFGSITFNGYYHRYRIYFKNLDTKEITYAEAGGEPWVPFNIWTPKGNLHHLGLKGDSFAIELPPGSYNVWGWQAGGARENNLDIIDFQIREGEALYFGSINYEQTHSHGTIITGARLFHLDQFKRDLIEFNKNYLKSNNSETRRLLKLGSNTPITKQGSNQSISIPAFKFW